MTNQEMLTIVKMRGWRLRSTKAHWSGNRCWYVEDEHGVVVVSDRYLKSVALQWAVALITKNNDRQQHLRWLETYEGMMK